MAKNKYAADYRLIEEFDSRGRVRVSLEYIGKDYRYAHGADRVRKHLKRCLAACAAAWLFFIAAIIPYTESMHQLSAALPYAFSALPLGMLTSFTLSLRGVKEPLEHRTSDRIENDYPAYCMALLLMQSITFMTASAGMIFRFFRGQMPVTGDFCFLSCCVFILAAAAFLLKKRSELETACADEGH